MMKFMICFLVILHTSILEKSDGQDIETADRLSLVDEIRFLTAIVGDIARGDFVAVIIDGCEMLLKMPTTSVIFKCFLKFVSKIMEMIHPVYLWMFPGAVDQGNLMGNVFSGMENGASTFNNVMSIAKFFM